MVGASPLAPFESPFAACSALCGVGSLAVLRRRRFLLARAKAAAAPSSLDAMVVAMIAGRAVAVPSFFHLLRVFTAPVWEEH